MRTAEEIFDDWARRGRDVGMEQGHFPRAERLLKRMILRPGSRVLDLGCGNGWAARWMLSQRIESSRPISATGVDLAPSMIAKARRVSDTNLAFIRASFSTLPFANSAFEEVFSMEALYYAGNFDRALEEIARVLSPGGRVYLATDYYLENPHCHSWPQDLDVPMKLLSAEEWTQALKAKGFAIDDCFRCLDPRPAPVDKPESERRAIDDFRQNIGSLAIIASRPA